jgi:hypothetical protein
MRAAFAALLLALPLAPGLAQAQGVVCNGQLQVGPVQLGGPTAEGPRGGTTYRDFSASLTNLTDRPLLVFTQVRGLPGVPLPSTREIEVAARQTVTASIARLPSTSTVTTQQVQAGLQVSCQSNRVM